MTTQTITTANGPITLDVEDSGGSGRPVVLIHGWPLSLRAWDDQVPALTDAGYRVITYTRRGFGDSDKPGSGYEYETFTDDLAGVLETLDLSDVTLVGFSMGGGEVARYVGKYGQDRLHSVVFAAAVPPYLLQTEDNPDGPLPEADATGMKEGLASTPREEFFDEFLTNFFTGGDEKLTVTEDQRQAALALAVESDQQAALACIDAFARTDFRDDLTAITVPALILHGDSDAIVPVEGSGERTHEAIAGSEFVVIEGGSHGINIGHAEAFDRALIDFLAR